MSTKEFMDGVNDFLLLTCGGATGQTFKKIIVEKKITGSAFFKPYESTADFFQQASSVVTAPISLALMSLEFLVLGIVAIPMSIADVCMGNTNRAIENIAVSGMFLLAVLPVMLAAFISSLVNLIDLIGSGCVSIAKACRDKEETAAGYGYGSI